MKILAIQGSPRGKEGNTEIILQDFLKGAVDSGAQKETVYLKEKKIKPCLGCFTCWTKTPGVCAIKDDMTELLLKVCACDVLIYATPLYNYNMTALLKAFQERCLPLADPHLIKVDNFYRHPSRYEHKRKMVLISNCGFPDTSYFAGLSSVFNLLERSSGTPLVGEILVPAGETLKQQALRPQKEKVFQAIYQAGVELAKNGRVSEKTQKIIQDPVFSTDDISAMANLWWDSYLSGNAAGKAQTGTVHDVQLILRGMAARLNADKAGSLKAVIQFVVSGKQTGNWHLTIADGNCAFNEGLHSHPTLIIKTPSDVWIGIANKEIDGQQALLEGKYIVQGDMALLMNMKNLFAGN